MNNQTLKIGVPYIESTDTTARLCSDILLPGGVSKVFYFEVEKKYEKYLCAEVSDAFVIGILNYAFAKGIDIYCQAPVTKRLLYQLNTYVLPTWPTTGNACYKEIKLSAESYCQPIENAGAVGTASSGGVDSYYSIVRHSKDQNISKRYRLTHLLIANQFNIYRSEEDTRKEFEELKESSLEIAENYNLELVTVYTNHHEFLFDGFVQQYSFRICSYIFALQKLFGVYYVSSGVPFLYFDFNNHDSDGADIFNLSMVSTDTLTFYSSGGEVGRTDKIAYFAADPFIQKHLKVCNYNMDVNCSTCEKCLRTMTSLDMIGRLNDYHAVFRLDEYKKRKNKYHATVLAWQWEASGDLIKSAEKYGYSYDGSSRLRAWICCRPVWNLKNLLKRIKFLRKLYFKLHLDYLVYGKEKATIYRYGTEYEE
jgi:hypothetical protein